jgi:outer membrane receptor protein involved in Fe transport
VQELYSKRYTGSPVNVHNPILRLLPSVNFSYNFTTKSLVRLAYAKTLNRPEFRELAPFSYYDFNTNTVLFGNDSLLTPDIHNVDVRYEFYPSVGEMITLGGFYKRFVNPIEMFFVPGTGSGGTRNFTFGNASYATSIGAELEIRKSLQSYFTTGFFSRLNVVANASYIVSNVELGPRAVGQNNNRPMMGQSPYIINTGLYYENTDAKLQVNLLYNVIGRRLFAVGTYGTPDIYEMQRNVVDLTIGKGFGEHFELRLSIQDILNQPVSLIQDANLDTKLNSKDEQVLKYKPGQYITLGINYKL